MTHTCLHAVIVAKRRRNKKKEEDMQKMFEQQEEPDDITAEDRQQRAAATPSDMRVQDEGMWEWGGEGARSLWRRLLCSDMRET